MTTDVLSKTDRSEVMRAIKDRNTGFELGFRSQLRQAGLPYKLQSRLPGRPDLVFPAARLAVFLDSCFWHGCRWHCRMPKSNVAYWGKKIARNRLRDKAVNAECTKLGWKVLRLWEHAIRRDPKSCVVRIKSNLRSH
jgi:DNA mismatch endonuclease (patch repair protein)